MNACGLADGQAALPHSARPATAADRFDWTRLLVVPIAVNHHVNLDIAIALAVPVHRVMNFLVRELSPRQGAGSRFHVRAGSSIPSEPVERGPAASQVAVPRRPGRVFKTDVSHVALA